MVPAGPSASVRRQTAEGEPTNRQPVVRGMEAKGDNRDEGGGTSRASNASG